jgi:hypothetical protein
MHNEFMVKTFVLQISNKIKMLILKGFEDDV